ncbi:MAG: hypothetical protein IJ215_00400 [Clostridia bacterium]|nr:hypothetical protein [Clostridia bacterium]
MRYSGTLIDENQKILSLISHEYVKLDFSSLSSLSVTNWNEPSFMDNYVLIYKANLPADITIYNILLEKLSSKIFLFTYINSSDTYIANADAFMIRAYVNYLITKEPVEYYIRAQFLPNKEYAKEILKVNKFTDCGVNVEHLGKNKFQITPLNITFENMEGAKSVYHDLLDLNDFCKDVNMDKGIILANYESVQKLSKDKRMLATLSNIKTYFGCQFNMKNGNIIFDGTEYMINDEESATAFQAKVIDAYHFFRNVINTKDKKDIISEIYNQKVSTEIKKEFLGNMASYINATKNQELVDWIVTISKESKYTLPISYDTQGIFYIDGAIIVTPLDAKEYYIDYMDKQREKLAMIIYKNNIIGKIKRIWDKFRARFARA